MFGDIIKELRTAHNYSQVQLAEKLGVSKQTVSNWENNNILPSIDMLIRISSFFSVTTDYLLELDTRHYIEVTGLTETQLTHIQQIIEDIKKRLKVPNLTFVVMPEKEYLKLPQTITQEYLSRCIWADSKVDEGKETLILSEEIDGLTNE